MRTWNRRRVAKIAIPLAAWLIGIVFVIPILYMVLTSLHHPQDAQTYPPSWGAPLTLENYAGLFTSASPITPALINSVITSVLSTLLVLALAIPAAYALAIRPVKKWSDVMFFFLSTKMLPMVAGILPLYLFTTKVINMPDNVIILILIYTAMNLPIAVWMMRSFLVEVPPAIIEAASIDGASTFRILTRIVAPIAMPGVAATSLICFIFAWNEQLYAKVLTSVAAQTGPVYVNTLIQTEHAYLAELAAGATLISLPVLIAGFAAQDKLVQGLSLGAVK
ncbi:carbohydrate ABC transporter permease [Nocardioides albus]|uniref:Sorbitol/mannitol transport system permease protein n=1 Tax=Nocardioides albus TaxID=1841 RepID=A0A7W5A614_9ACTN|nr:carbohydrate ABC transporter permease [Nocardioides albus]MBB3090231.1 sorbitol/mannitol transport system permease protein [Nocardioides albus]GGU28654.1 mannitol ABC transporter permease [Nocardioides albus]